MSSGSDFLAVVGLPTFKRPQGLTRLLESLEKQLVDFPVQVLVADNDEEKQEGMQVVADLKRQGYRFPLDSFVVAERGISQVRNALMQRAFEEYQGDVLAMLDDDEWAEEEWLSALVRVQRLTDADVVGGNVFAEFTDPPPSWLKGLEGYPRKNTPLSGYVPLIYGTTNVLLSRDVTTRFPGQCFDPFYALVGRGDTEFFTRLKKDGAIFAFSHQAKSHEVFGPSRTTKQWARERAFCDGAGHMRIVLRDWPGLVGMAVEFMKMFGAVAVALVRIGVNLRRDDRRMAGQILIMRQVGKLSALSGKYKRVYREVHGN